MKTFKLFSKNGNVYSFLKKPVIKNGKKFHVKHGLQVIYSEKFWYLNGKLHREDGPAVELENGDKSWYKNGKLHREDGPAIEYVDGSKSWCINGKLHREDGPAIERADGTKCWYKNGQCHREDGPAVKWAKGSKEWWLNDNRLTEEQFNEQKKFLVKEK